jgi:hypothetical protein
MPVGAAPSRSECVTRRGHHDTSISDWGARFDALTRQATPGVDAAMFARQALAASR